MTENTDNTANVSANTDNSGQANQSAESTNQDAGVSRLKALEKQVARFDELEKTNKTLEQQSKTAQAERLRWESSYRSLQASTTSSLQDAARLRQQAAEQARILDELSANRQELTQVREGLTFLASKVVD